MFLLADLSHNVKKNLFFIFDIYIGNLYLKFSLNEVKRSYLHDLFFLSVFLFQKYVLNFKSMIW